MVNTIKGKKCREYKNFPNYSMTLLVFIKFHCFQSQTLIITAQIPIKTSVFRAFYKEEGNSYKEQVTNSEDLHVSVISPFPCPLNTSLNAEISK